VLKARSFQTGQETCGLGHESGVGDMVRWVVQLAPVQTVLGHVASRRKRACHGEFEDVVGLDARLDQCNYLVGDARRFGKSFFLLILFQLIFKFYLR
jgi:hypothetical protein